MSDLLAWIPVNHMYAKCPKRPEEGFGFFRIRGNEGFWATMSGLDKPGSFGKTASILND